MVLCREQETRDGENTQSWGALLRATAAASLKKRWRRKDSPALAPKSWPKTLVLDVAHFQRELLQHVVLSCLVVIHTYMATHTPAWDAAQLI